MFSRNPGIIFDETVGVGDRVEVAGQTGKILGFVAVLQIKTNKNDETRHSFLVPLRFFKDENISKDEDFKRQVMDTKVLVPSLQLNTSQSE